MARKWQESWRNFSRRAFHLNPPFLYPPFLLFLWRFTVCRGQTQLLVISLTGVKSDKSEKGRLREWVWCTTFEQIWGFTQKNLAAFHQETFFLIRKKCEEKDYWPKPCLLEWLSHSRRNRKACLLYLGNHFSFTKVFWTKFLWGEPQQNAWKVMSSPK